jgi:ferredoxin/flavodoxin---NADP+ reductase
MLGGICYQVSYIFSLNTIKRTSSMNKIVEKEYLSDRVVKLVITATRIAEKRKAGHFVIIRIGEKGERIPLTISSADPLKGTITLIIQKVGVTSHKVANLNVGDEITDISGPLGQPTDIVKVGTVLCAGGGVGIAPLLPIVEAMKKVGNKVITVLAGRSKELIILEKEIRENSDEVIIMTDDGSYGNKGLVTNGMEKIIQREKIDLTIAIGPAIMMKYASLLTKKYNIPTLASLNSIMVDGTGMCGACRITVNGKTRFVCVDGPEFHADEIDFDELLMRLNAYSDEEYKAFQNYKEKEFAK